MPPTEGRCPFPDCHRFFEHGHQSLPTYEPPRPTREELEQKRQAEAEKERLRELYLVADGWTQAGQAVAMLDQDGSILTFQDDFGQTRDFVAFGWHRILFEPRCVSLAIPTSGILLVTGPKQSPFSQFTQSAELPPTITYQARGNDEVVRFYEKPALLFGTGLRLGRWRDYRIESGVPFLDIYLNGSIIASPRTGTAAAPQFLIDALQGAL
jgi:hypothetical protein